MEIVTPKSEHTHTLIILHGRGSNATEFKSELLDSQASDGRSLFDTFPNFKWVFPNAPLVYSKRFDEDISQWWDMWSTENPNERSEEQQEELRRSVAVIKQLVLSETDGIGGLENIFLCGISQGAASGILVLLELDARLAGFVGFSTWMPESEGQDFKSNEDALRTPVFLAHCQNDEVIGIEYGETMKKHLEYLGMSVAWHSYPDAGQYEDSGHWMNEPQGMDDVVAFLKTVTSRNSG